MFNNFFNKKKCDPELELINKVFTKEEILVGQSSRIGVPFGKCSNGIITYIRISSGYEDKPYLNGYYIDTNKNETWIGYTEEYYAENFDYVVKRLLLLKEQVQIEMQRRASSDQDTEKRNQTLMNKIKSLRIP